MANSLLAYSDDEGPVRGYKYPLSDEAKAEIEKEQEEEEVGFDPLRAAALSAGASLLRNTGWSPRPMSLGQQIGHAIPHGMQAYYNQDALNQNEQAALYERQQAEQTALDAKLKLEDDARIQEQDQASFTQMMNELGLSVTEQKSMLRFYMKNPKEASAYLAKQIYEKKEGKGPKNKYEKIEEKERERLGLPKNVHQKVIPQDGSVPFYVDKMGTQLAMAVEEEDEPINTYRKIEQMERERLELPENVYQLVTPKDGSVPFYIDKMGTQLTMPVEEEEEEEAEIVIGFVDDPKSANLIVTENGQYKTSVPRVKEGEVVTPQMVQGVYDGLVDLDPANEPTYNALREQIETGSSTKVVYDALMDKLKAFKKEATPEKIDYTGVSQNIYDKLIAATDDAGRPVVVPLKLIGIMELPPEERFDKLKNVLDSIDTMSYTKFVSEGGLEVRKASLQQTRDQYANEQTKYIKREQVRLADEARKMNWGESRLMMAEQSHDRKIRQMDKNWEDGQKKNLVTAKEWVAEKGGELPKGVAFVERRPDGKMGKLINNDWTTYTAPLNTGAKTEVSDEINRLFKKYEGKFTPKDIDEIKGLLWSKDPMEALKKAHARLQDKGERGIQAPASILKKFGSDMGVRRAANEALAMMNDPVQMAIIEKEVGFFYGQVTEKAKHPLFQKFKAIATLAALTKRHELIGSQMTDGELKFTEPMFPSDKDTRESLMIKLQTMLSDANYNIDLTRRMFSAEAGYNDKVWVDDATWHGGSSGKPTTAADLE